MRAMILAAGKGTRLQSLTADTPKALVKVGGVPLLERVICLLKQQGIMDMVINVHHFGEQIIAFLESRQNFGCHISVSDERADLLDTGGGVWHAAPLLANSGPVVVHNVDVISDIAIPDLVRVHQEKGAMATLAVLDRTSSRSLLFDPQGQLAGWRNNSTGATRMVSMEGGVMEPLAFCGISVLNPLVFSRYPREGAFSLIEAFLEMAAKERVERYKPSMARWMDIGKIEDFSEAERFVMEMPPY